MTVSDKLLLSPRELADLMGVSTRRLTSLVASGRVPPPIQLSNTPEDRRWNRQTIQEWVEAGCPHPGGKLDTGENA